MRGVQNILEKYDSVFEYFGVALKLTIAYQFWALWYDPQLEDAPRIYNLLSLMIFEFIMVHSGIFMAAFPKKISLFIFVPFYGIFALIFNAIMDDNTIIYIYMLVVFNRMRFAFADVPNWMHARAIIVSVAAMLIYMVLIFVSLFGILPKLGLDEEYLIVSNFASIAKTSGEFVDAPYKAISFGFIYYIALALLEGYMIKTNSGGDVEEPKPKPVKRKRRYER